MPKRGLANPHSRSDYDCRLDGGETRYPLDLFPLEFGYLDRGLLDSNLRLEVGQMNPVDLPNELGRVSYDEQHL